MSRPQATASTPNKPKAASKAPRTLPVPAEQQARQWSRLSFARINAGDLEGAELAANEAIALAPKLFEACVARATLHAQKKRYAEAVPYYVEALRQRPDAISEWTALGELCLALLDYQNAANALQTAIRLDPHATHPAGRRARSVFVRALQTLKGNQ